MKNYTVGFIGYGNMAQAIVSALVNKRSESEEASFDVAVFDTDEQKIAKAKESGLVVMKSNADLISTSDYIFIAVKPQTASVALRDCDFTGKTLISIMAGTSINSLKKLTSGTAKKIVRVMPNLNAKIFKSCSSYCYEGIDESEKQTVVKMLTAFGTATQVREEDMSVTTGLCGSAPAFVYKFINAFINSAKEYGFSEEDAQTMAIQTILGSVESVLCASQNGKVVKVQEMVDAVCSKGGTTIEGVNYLNDNNFEEIVKGAIRKSVLRAEEMSKQNEER